MKTALICAALLCSTAANAQYYQNNASQDQAWQTWINYASANNWTFDRSCMPAKGPQQAYCSNTMTQPPRSDGQQTILFRFTDIYGRQMYRQICDTYVIPSVRDCYNVETTEYTKSVFDNEDKSWIPQVKRVSGIPLGLPNGNAAPQTPQAPSVRYDEPPQPPTAGESTPERPALVAIRDLNVRTLADPKSAALGTIPAGQAMFVNAGQCSIWTGPGRGINVWCPVIYGGLSGWANVFFVQDIEYGKPLACVLNKFAEGCR